MDYVKALNHVIKRIMVGIPEITASSIRLEMVHLRASYTYVYAKAAFPLLLMHK